jgi:hypothetical protein
VSGPFIITLNPGLRWKLLGNKKTPEENFEGKTYMKKNN